MIEDVRTVRRPHVFACSIVLNKDGPTAEVVRRRRPRRPHESPTEGRDATASRAEGLGATIVMRAEDIPGIARFTVIRDPHGAVLALMKPSPRAKK